MNCRRRGTNFVVVNHQSPFVTRYSQNETDNGSRSLAIQSTGNNRVRTATEMIATASWATKIEFPSSPSKIIFSRLFWPWHVILPDARSPHAKTNASHLTASIPFFDHSITCHIILSFETYSVQFAYPPRSVRAPQYINVI